MIVYNVLFLLLFLFYLLSKTNATIPNKNYTLILITCILLVLFSGLRGLGVDRDSYNYSYYFSTINNYSDLSSGLEPLFTELIVLLKFIGFTSISALFFVVAIISIPVKIRAILKYSSSPFLSIIIYYSFMYFKQDFTAIRAAIAIGIFLWSIDDLWERNSVKFFLKIILASLFHMSAVVYVIVYFINLNRLNKKYYLMFLWGSAVISNLGLFTIMSKLPFLNTIQKVDRYVQKVSTGVSDSFNPKGVLFLLNLFIISILLLFSDRIVSKDKRSILFIKLTAIGVGIIYIFGPLSVIVASRLSDLFLITMIFSCTYFTYFMRPRFFGVVFTIILAIVLFWFNMYYVGIVNNYYTFL